MTFFAVPWKSLATSCFNLIGFQNHHYFIIGGFLIIPKRFTIHSDKHKDFQGVCMGSIAGIFRPFVCWTWSLLLENIPNERCGEKSLTKNAPRFGAPVFSWVYPNHTPSLRVQTAPFGRCWYVYRGVHIWPLARNTSERSSTGACGNRHSAGSGSVGWWFRCRKKCVDVLISVEGSQIRKDHQLRLAVEISLFL